MTTSSEHTMDSFEKEKIVNFLQSRLPIINQANKQLALFLAGVGVSNNQPDIYRNSGFLYHQMLIITEGSGILEYDNVKLTVTAPDCIFIPKDIPHTYYSICEKWKLLWFCFDGTCTEQILKSFSLTSITVIHPRNELTLPTLHQKLLTSASHRYDAERLSVMIYELLVEYYKQMQYDIHNLAPICEMEKIKRYIDQNYKLNLSLDSLADTFKLSKYTICKEYKKFYGLSPNQYQLQLRIQEAKYLLIHTRYSIKKIGEMVGFEDNVYFGQRFKKIESLTPKQYREIFKNSPFLKKELKD